MSFKWLLTLFILAVFVFLPFWAAHAQGDEGDYIVTSPQSINARSCPHVSCGVVTHFAPGDLLTVSEAVEGDTVSGSNRWLHIQQAGIDAYVHSSLVARSSDNSASAATSAVDMGGWVDHRTNGFSLKTPAGYYDGARLLANDELMRSLAETFGLDPADVKENINNSLRGSDMYLFRTNCDCWLLVAHEDTNGRQVTARRLQATLVAALEDNGEEILSKAIVTLPAGTSIRFYVKWTEEVEGKTREGYQVFYAIITARRVYYVTFNTSPANVVEDQPYFDAVAGSFKVSEPARDSQGRLVRQTVLGAVVVA